MGYIKNYKIHSRVGRHILYTLNEQDVARINQRREQAGRATLSGNPVHAGDQLPGIIVTDWGPHLSSQQGDTLPDGFESWEEYQNQTVVNAQVSLDGYDTHWVTSVGMELERYQYDPVEKMTYDMKYQDRNDPLPDEVLERLIVNRQGRWIFA